MTLTLTLSPETEEKLMRRALLEGIPLSELAVGILEGAPFGDVDAETLLGDGTHVGDMPARVDDAVDRARAFYDRELRTKLEASQLNQLVAIHPDTDDFVVERWPGRALRALKEKHPTSPIFVRFIGVANEGLRAHILSKTSSTCFEAFYF